MFTRILSVTLMMTSTLFYTEAQAEWSFGGGLENFRWEETIAGSPLSPTENGMRYALNATWLQDGDQGLLFSYRGKLYTGRVHYDTYTQISNTPVSTTTQYSGATHEGQMLYRTDTGRLKLDYVGGVGLDTWERNIDNRGYSQIEDYFILYLRGGINIGQTQRATGWHGGGGLKYPFWTAEDAHLQEQGFYTNPIISPGKAVSLYAELGYRFSPRWDIVGYYDSWHFKQSAPVVTADSSGTWLIWQPESHMDVWGLKAMVSF